MHLSMCGERAKMLILPKHEGFLRNGVQLSGEISRLLT
jgi:hypothetical protein